MGENAALPATTFPEETLKKTVQTFPKPEEGGTDVHILTTALTSTLASLDDRITPWGQAPNFRDRELRQFWPSEPYLAGAIYSVITRNAAYEWELKGTDDNLIKIYTDVLNSALGRDRYGWIPFIQALTEDYLTQDNGCFIELIRMPTIDVNSKFKGEKAPVVGLAHLDANCCTRTGNPKTPVIYDDEKGNPHKLKWYQVIPIVEFPSSIRRMHGIGYSAVTRILRMAQILKSIEVYKDEKVGGRHFKALHIVSGVNKMQIDDTMREGQEEANNKGQIRFTLPAILASIDPETPVSHVEIPLASLPDQFDFDQEMKWYISGIALGLGVDYQDLAPLPSNNIGSSNQSEILHRKSRGKGQALWMETMTNVFSNYGALPRSLTLSFQVKDMAEELEQQEMRKAVAEEVAIMARAGILSPAAIRADLIKRGLYDDEIINMIEEDYGMDILLGGKGQLLGATGGNTMAEDAGRTQKGLVDRIFGR